MADQVAKSPSEVDWHQEIDTFRRFREFDRAEFCKRAKQLVLTLKREAKDARKTADDTEHEQQFQPNTFTKHGKDTVTGQLIRKGYAEQLDLAQLDLLQLDLADPQFNELLSFPLPLVDFGEKFADARRQLTDRFLRHGIDPVGAWGTPGKSGASLVQRPVTILRRQAVLMLDGADRVQRCIDHHKQRLAAIKRSGTKGYASVATHDLLEWAERWNVETREIAKRLVAAKVLPARESEHDDLEEQWYKSLKRARSEWRDRWKQQRQREPKARKQK